MTHKFEGWELCKILKTEWTVLYIKCYLTFCKAKMLFKSFLNNRKNEMILCQPVVKNEICGFCQV